MSPRRHDFAGQRFGLLTALEDGPRYRNGELVESSGRVE